MTPLTEVTPRNHVRQSMARSQHHLQPRQAKVAGANETLEAVMEYIPAVGAKVHYGREHGEHTLGEVIKVNRSACKVKQLEKRGAHGIGTVWTVPFALISPLDGATPAPVGPPAPVDELTMLRAENARLQGEVERLRKKTAHVRASEPAMPAVKPLRKTTATRPAARASAN